MGGDREQVIQLMEVTQAATGWFGSGLEQLRWRRCSCSLECAASVASVAAAAAATKPDTVTVTLGVSLSSTCTFLVFLEIVQNNKLIFFFFKPAAVCLVQSTSEQPAGMAKLAA